MLAAYKTLMRYKKLSADFRDAIELYDPNPASLVFDGPDEPWLVPIRERAHKLLDGCGMSFRELTARIAKVRQQSGFCSVNYDNCHLMNVRNEALCRRATGEEVR